MANGIEMSKISEGDKTFRIIVGGALVGGAALGLNKLFFVIIGGLLLASGFTGLCAVSSFLGKKK